MFLDIDLTQNHIKETRYILCKVPKTEEEFMDGRRLWRVHRTYDDFDVAFENYKRLSESSKDFDYTIKIVNLELLK